MTASARQEGGTHAHYFRDVSHLSGIDFYRFCDLYRVDHPCAQHAAKKVLFAGVRGAKNIDKDIQEAIDTLERWKAMRAEDAGAAIRLTPLPVREMPAPVSAVGWMDVVPTSLLELGRYNMRYDDGRVCHSVVHAGRPPKGVVAVQDFPVHETPEPTDPRRQAKADAEGWIYGSGTLRYVPGQKYELKYEGGEIAEFCMSDSGLLLLEGVLAYRLHKPSQPAEPEKAAEMVEGVCLGEARKVWKAGQRWQYKAAPGYSVPVDWESWHDGQLDGETFVYRRHPEDRDPEPQQWPYYSAGPNHDRAKELWGDGKGMEVRIHGTVITSTWDRGVSPRWLESCEYEIRPQGAQA